MDSEGTNPSNNGTNEATPVIDHRVREVRVSIGQDRERDANCNGTLATETPKDQFRRDAKIWGLYLKEANEQAKAQAEIWETSLKSLLLFAGLFASVVASFLIDSRRKLQLEDQEFLLRDIRNALRDLPPPNQNEPTLPTLWINGLWFASLLITLFSAILGVLARSWLVNYVPVKIRQESVDAYQRWMLDQRTEKWKMEQVITVIPFLVQLAFFLFAAGLGILVFNDNQTIGAVILGTIGLGTLVYLLFTALPLFLPTDSCPFKTPLSDILLTVQKLFMWLLRPKHQNSRHSVPIPLVDSNTLAKIWRNKLINSPKPDHVDEAIAELTRNDLTDDCINKFTKSNTPEICLKRLESCMTSDYQDLPKRDEIMANNLLALSIFIAYSERIKYGNDYLRTTLHHSLAPEMPLSRWNFLPEPVRPLAFSIRTPILLHFDDDAEKAEVDEHPWERLASSLQLQPKHRFRFLLSACRALVKGKDNLKTISSFSIAFCMAFAARDERKSDWGALKKKDKEAKDLAQKYMADLFHKISLGWEKGAAEYLKVESLFAVPGPEKEIDSAGLPGSLAVALVHPRGKYRQQAAQTVMRLAQTENCEHKNAIRMAFPTLIDIAISDKDADVRKTAIDALKALGKQVEHVEWLKKRFPGFIEEKLSRLWPSGQQEALDLLLLLTDVPDFQHVFEPTIGILMAAAFRVKPDSRTRMSATRLLEVLVKDDRIHQILENATKDQILLHLNSDIWLNRYFALEHAVPMVVSLSKSFASTLFKGESLQRIMVAVSIPIVTCAMSDRDPNIRNAGRTAVQLLLERDPPDEIHSNIFSQLKSEISSALSVNECSIQIDALNFIRAHSDLPQLDGIIEGDILEKISGLVFNGTNDDVGVAGLALFTELVAKARLKAAVVRILPPSLSQYKGPGWGSRKGLIQLLEKLILSGDRRDGLAYILRLTVSDDHSDVRDAGLKSLISLCDETEQIRDLVKAELPLTINLSTNDDAAGESLGWAKLLFYLMRNGAIRDHCCTILQSGLDRTTQASDVTVKNKHVDGQEDVASETGMNLACSLLAHLSCEENVQQPIRTAALEILHYQLQGENVELAWKCYKDLAPMLLADANPTVALRYVTLMASGALKYELGDVTLLVKILTDSEKKSTTELRCQILEVLKAVGRKERPAAGIVKSLESHLAEITGTGDYLVRMAWAKLLSTLARTANFVAGISQLVMMASKDEDPDVRRASLNALAALVEQTAKKHADIIWSANELSNNLDSISTKSCRERLSWARILSALSKHADKFDLGSQKLIDLVIEDDDSDVRAVAYDGLEKLDEDDKGKDFTINKLTKAFEVALRHPHIDRRSQAIRNLREDYFKDKLKFGDVLERLVGPLLRVALNDESDLVQEAVVELLITANSSRLMQRIKPAILKAISSVVAELTEKNKPFVLGLIKAMPDNEISDDAVSAMARTVTQLFNQTYTPARMSAIEILPLLYKKGLSYDFIYSNIPDLVTLALEDNHEDIRITALNFLITLCGKDAFRFKINTSQPRLMTLLENRYLRSTAIELLSLLSKDVSVRRSVASWIIASVTGDVNAQLEGIMELLSSLVIDQRFGEDLQGSDYILLFLASALVLKPSMAKFRSRLTASLWCNYKDLAEKAKKNPATIPESLVDSFTLAIFGRHVMSYELKEWMDMQSYLQPKDAKAGKRS